jgi:cell division protein FtsB
MAQKKARKKKPSAVLLLVLTVLIVVVGVEIINVYGRLKDVRAQEAALTQQMQEKAQAYEALRSDLSKKDDPEFIKALARDLLGLAEDGERIFYDVND